MSFVRLREIETGSIVLVNTASIQRITAERSPGQQTENRDGLPIQSVLHLVVHTSDSHASTHYVPVSATGEDDAEVCETNEALATLQNLMNATI